ncbi:FAD-dependent oxidoreductase, partial [Amycolatopsis rhizosphaerae]
MSEVETVVVGAGLAGLTCALQLAGQRREVLLLEARDVAGGRTSSWEERGMPVESGLHRVLGCGTELPRLLRRAGMSLDEVVYWEDELEFRTPSGARAVLGASPLYNPLRTLLGPLVSWDLLAPWDLASLVPFLTAGVARYLADPDGLDRFSLAAFARRWRVTDTAVRNLLVPASAGVFFLPPSRYSAANFFGLLVPALPGIHRTRVGAFRGGMTEVLADPLVAAIRARGGEVRTGTEVLGVRMDLGAAAPEVTGVDTAAGTVGARHVV